MRHKQFFTLQPGHKYFFIKFRSFPIFRDGKLDKSFEIIFLLPDSSFLLENKKKLVAIRSRGY